MTSFKIKLASPKTDGDNSDSDHFGEFALSPNESTKTQPKPISLRSSSDWLFWSGIGAAVLLSAFIGWYFLVRSPIPEWIYLADSNGAEYSYRIENRDTAKMRVLVPNAERLKIIFGMNMFGLTKTDSPYDHSEATIRFSDDFKQFVVVSIENIDRDGKIINSMDSPRGWMPITNKSELPIKRLALEMKSSN